VILGSIGKNGLIEVEEKHAKGRTHRETKEKDISKCVYAQTCVLTHKMRFGQCAYAEVMTHDFIKCKIGAAISGLLEPNPTRF